MYNQDEFLKRHAESIIEAYLEGKCDLQLTVLHLKDDMYLGLEVSYIRSKLSDVIENHNQRPQSESEKGRLNELKRVLLDS